MGPRLRAIGLLEQAGAPNKVQMGLFDDHKAPGARWGPISSVSWALEQVGPKQCTIPYGALWG